MRHRTAAAGSERSMNRWLLAPLLALSHVAIAATGHGVNVGGGMNQFSPQTITIDPGDSVTFINKGGFHNAVADDGSFRCAQGCDGVGNGNGGASSALWIASITLTKPGPVGYFCEVHGAPGEGMYGTIIVTGTVAAPKLPVPASTPVFLAILIGAIVAVVATVVALRRR
jgi:plastocyanin